MSANLDRLTHSYALESNTVLRIGEYGMERIFCQDLIEEVLTYYHYIQVHDVAYTVSYVFMSFHRT